MNIAVLEDDYNDRIKLEELLTDIDADLDIDFYPSGEAFLETGKNKKYQLIFMDIYMGLLDGIETAAYIEKTQENALIIYLTSSEQDIWRAVATHGCFDYIRKSQLTKIRLEKLFIDVVDKLQIVEKHVTFQSGKQEITLKSQHIQYIVSRNKYTTIVFSNNLERSYRVTFSQLYAFLHMEKDFLLCNRGVLLNMKFIQKMDVETCQMQDGNKFPMRRKDRRAIIDRYNDYQFDCLDSQGVID